MKNDYIYTTFNDQPVTMVAGKRYCTTSITDHTPITEPALLRQIMDEMTAKVDFSKADCLVGEEDRGGYICALMSLQSGKPFTLTKWNPNELQGDVMINFKNAYTSGSLYLNGLKKLAGKKVIIVEDMIDTGGTIVAMVELLRKHDVEVIDIIAIADKLNYGGLSRVKNETGITPKVLVTFWCDETKSQVLKRYN